MLVMVNNNILHTQSLWEILYLVILFHVYELYVDSFGLHSNFETCPPCSTIFYFDSYMAFVWRMIRQVSFSFNLYVDEVHSKSLDFFIFPA